MTAVLPTIGVGIGGSKIALGLADHEHPVAVNDVHEHGAGEVWRGAGAGNSLILLAAVGTGLGGAVGYRGVPLMGEHGASRHLGCIRSAEVSGLRCSCGSSSHLEAIALGYGLVRLYHQLGGDSSVGSACELSEQVSRDPKAAEALARSAAALEAAGGDLANIVDPEQVIISGGVSQAEPISWPGVRKAAVDISLSLIADPRIVPATLGPCAGVIRAAVPTAHDSAREGA